MENRVERKSDDLEEAPEEREDRQGLMSGPARKKGGVGICDNFGSGIL